MKKLYLYIQTTLLALGVAVAITGTAHGQNYSGTVSPEEPSIAVDEAGPFVKQPLETPQAAHSPNTTVINVDGVEVEIPNLPNINDTSLSTYTLGAQDVIEVSVLRHPEVSGQYLINNEGNIQFEFVGDVNVEGKTKDEVKEVLTGLLTEYIIAPEVTVKVVGYNSKIVYVIGEVARPGKIFMRGDTITVREALMQAGLPLLTAATKKGKVFTPAETGDVKQKNVNVYTLLYEGDLRENIVLKPGDTLYVPATIMAKTMRVINPIAQPIGTVSGAGRTVMSPF